LIVEALDLLLLDGVGVGVDFFFFGVGVGVDFFFFAASAL
jgi:hypothetical protein